MALATGGGVGLCAGVIAAGLELLDGLELPDGPAEGAVVRLVRIWPPSEAELGDVTGQDECCFGCVVPAGPGSPMAKARAWNEAAVGESLFDLSEEEEEDGDGVGKVALRASLERAEGREVDAAAAGGVEGSSATTTVSPCSSAGRSGRSV